MTVVDAAETVLDASEARRITTAAQTEFRSSADHFIKGWALIEEAVKGGGHLALGYRSPGDYLVAEFDGVLSGINVPERRLAVRMMTDLGLSTRAMAPVTKVSIGTIHNDQVFNSEHLVNDLPATSTGSAGGSLTRSQEPTAPATALTSVEPGTAPEQVEPPASAGAARTITGIDGKTYRPVDHEARARVAVERYPDLSWQFEQRDFEHCWRTADKLDEFAERGQLEERLDNLRRYNALEKAKQDGTYVPPAAPSAVPEEERRRRQEAQDRLDWHQRAAHYLGSFMAHWSLATGLRSHPEREEILAQLDPKSRARFLQLESEHPEWS